MKEAFDNMKKEKDRRSPSMLNITAIGIMRGISLKKQIKEIESGFWIDRWHKGEISVNVFFMASLETKHITSLLYRGF